MIYVVGVIGFIGGFVIGQMVLFFFLRNVPREDLLNDPYIKWKYGMLNWFIALVSCYAMVQMYQRFFL